MSEAAESSPWPHGVGGSHARCRGGIRNLHLHLNPATPESLKLSRNPEGGSGNLCGSWELTREAALGGKVLKGLVPLGSLVKPQV